MISVLVDETNDPKNSTWPLKIDWKATTNKLALTCNYADSKDFSTIGGLLNSTIGDGGSTGGVEVKFTSVTNDDTASLVLELLKSY